MTDNIDKKLKKLAEERKKEIKNEIKAKEDAKKEEEEFTKREIKKFNEVYSDLKKVCEKLGKFEKCNGELYMELNEYAEIRLTDEKLEMSLNDRIPSRGAKASHYNMKHHEIGPRLDINCFAYYYTGGNDFIAHVKSMTKFWEDVKILDDIQLVGDYLESSVKKPDIISVRDSTEIYFFSKRKLISFFIKLIMSYLTDSQIEKNF